MLVPGDTDVGSHCDECDTIVTLPFPFQLYNGTFNSVSVSSNGRLDFVVPNESGGYARVALPASQGPNGPYEFTIFALWHDLTTETGLSGCSNFASGCGIFTSVSGSAPDRIFNIEFRTVRFDDNTQTQQFEVRLYENSSNRRFDVMYGPINGVTEFDTAGVQGDADAGFFTEDFCDTVAPENVSRTYTAEECASPSPTPRIRPTPDPRPIPPGWRIRCRPMRKKCNSTQSPPRAGQQPGGFKTMSKKALTALTLPLLLLFGPPDAGSANSVAQKQKSSNSQNEATGILQKMIVESGTVTMDLDLNRLNGIIAPTQKLETLRFAVAANSFFSILVFNDLLRGP